MAHKDFLISVIDLLLIMTIILLLAVFAVRYDQNQGLKDLDYIGITPLKGSPDIDGDLNSYNFYAFLLKQRTIEYLHYNKGISKHLKTFTSVNQISKDSVLNPSHVYVIYEEERNPYLADIARLFALRSIPIGLASVTQ